jgi:hypothetical protein
VHSNYDDFFTVVSRVEEIRKALSPGTRTTIDEIGVILPDDNDAAAPAFPLIYWSTQRCCRRRPPHGRLLPAAR